MEQAVLAEQLIAADDAQRAALLAEHAALLDVELARAFKAQFDAAESSDPQRVQQVTAALAALAAVVPDPEVQAFAAWVGGMAAQFEGDMEASLHHLNDAEQRFASINQPLSVAQTQVSKLISLAILGRYEEAIATGLHARDVFVSHGDELAAGKIEQNLGNIYFRQERYVEAEQFYLVAHEKFTTAKDQKFLILAENGLANVLSQRHNFRIAIELYERALARAHAMRLQVSQAMIECNIGSLTLFQGNYDQALDYLERSRRRYAALGMPHESAIAEQEMADAYLELNLLPEAAAIYDQVVPQFAALGMHAEQARALAYSGRTRLLLGDFNHAHDLLSEAQSLYQAENNAVGVAATTLSEALLHHAQDDNGCALALAEQAEAPLAAAGVRGNVLLARWLRGDCLRKLGRHTEAQTILEAARAEAEHDAVPQIAQRCLTSLGLLAAASGDTAQAEECFKQAIVIIETLRAPLPTEEFRAAFVADKLAPYTEVVRLCLADSTSQRMSEALGYVERARSRALVDMLGGALQAQVEPRDAFEADVLARLDQLREELNWFYSQINRQPDQESTRGAAAVAELYDAVRTRETAVLDLTRQLQQRNDHVLAQVETLDVHALQAELADNTVLVEYFILHDELLAFVVTNTCIDVVRHLAPLHAVEATLRQVRFQMDALRYGTARLRDHMDQLTERAQHHLQVLYDLLLRPLDARLDGKRLLVVPHRTLHYVPFHALHDGTHYVVERREVCVTPSATVLRHCLEQPQRGGERAVVLGVADDYTPKVAAEVAAITPLFRDTLALLDQQATVEALHQHASTADVLHLACHGQFRPDNPLFSSLRLGDGWFTVRDAYVLDLHCDLVTLSACETGISAVAPGDELIGLARGFFGAGAPSLLVSQWTVDDESTALLMAHFYARLRAGARPAAALRAAQQHVMQGYPHPYFWAPFMVLGRW